MNEPDVAAEDASPHSKRGDAARDRDAAAPPGGWCLVLLALPVLGQQKPVVSS